MANSLNRNVMILDTLGSPVQIGGKSLDTAWYLRIRHMTWVYQPNPGDQLTINDANGNQIYKFNDQMAGKAISFSDIHAYNGLQLTSNLTSGNFGQLIIDLD